MKNLQILFIGILFFSQSNISTQTTSSSKIYKVWVESTTEEKFVAYLGELQESSIILLDVNNQMPFPDLGVNKIETLKFRKKGGVLTGAAIGAALGFATGAVLFMGDECKNDSGSIFFSCQDVSPISGGAGIGMLGAIVGAAIGSIKVKIPIRGNQSDYERNVERMRKYLY